MTARITTDPTNAAGAWLGLELARQRYAVPLAHVREVIRYEPPTPVPGAPADVLGIVNLRGSIVSIIDGRKRLGFPSRTEHDDRERCVIIDFGDEAVGVRIDAMGDVLDLSDADIAPAPPGRAARQDDPVEGVVTFEDGFVALLDVRQLCHMSTHA